MIDIRVSTAEQETPAGDASPWSLSPASWSLVPDVSSTRRAIERSSDIKRRPNELASVTVGVGDWVEVRLGWASIILRAKTERE